LASSNKDIQITETERDTFHKDIQYYNAINTLGSRYPYEGGGLGIGAITGATVYVKGSKSGLKQKINKRFLKV